MKAAQHQHWVLYLLIASPTPEPLPPILWLRLPLSIKFAAVLMQWDPPSEDQHESLPAHTMSSAQSPVGPQF